MELFFVVDYLFLLYFDVLLCIYPFSALKSSSGNVGWWEKSGWGEGENFNADKRKIKVN